MAAQQGWRYRVGVWMFLVPVVTAVATPIVVPMLGLDAGTAAALIGGIIIGGELIWFASIPLLGKEGFKELKTKLFGVFKIPAGPVSRTRHRVGVGLVLGAFVAEMLAVLFLIVAYFEYAPGTYPSSTLLGMEFEAQATTFIVVQCASALCAVASLYVLGAEFVERLQAAFSWNGPMVNEP